MQERIIKVRVGERRRGSKTRRDMDERKSKYAGGEFGTRQTAT